MIWFLIKTGIKVRKYLLYLAFVLKLIDTLEQIKTNKFVKLLTNDDNYSKTY